jgi:hypothetical protein
MTTDNFCFHLQNKLIQTSQTGGQWYSDTTPFSIPCSNLGRKKYDNVNIKVDLLMVPIQLSTKVEA